MSKVNLWVEKRDSSETNEVLINRFIRKSRKECIIREMKEKTIYYTKGEKRRIDKRRNKKRISRRLKRKV